MMMMTMTMMMMTRTEIFLLRGTMTIMRFPAVSRRHPTRYRRRGRTNGKQQHHDDDIDEPLTCFLELNVIKTRSSINTLFSLLR